MEPRLIQPRQQEVGRQGFAGDRGQEGAMQMKNSNAGSIASGPAMMPATMASRSLVRWRMTGRMTTAPMML